MKEVSKEVKYLVDKDHTERLRPTKDVLNYYVYYWGWEKALEVFNLTTKQAEKILFDYPYSGKQIGFQHLKEKPFIQGNIDPVLDEGRAVHDTVEYRSLDV